MANVPKQYYPFGQAGKTNAVAASMFCFFEGSSVKLTKQSTSRATNFTDISIEFYRSDLRAKCDAFVLVHSYYKKVIPNVHPQALERTKALAKTSYLE